MEFRHLRYFIAVAEECSFSRAAEKLHVSQPPLSRQIRDLEAELGVKLLERNRQGVRLTRLGTVVLARARALVRDADAFKTEAKLLDREIHEELRIGYAPSPTAVIIAKVLYAARPDSYRDLAWFEDKAAPRRANLATP